MPVLPEPPSPMPKVTLPVWAYVLIAVFVIPIGTAYLTGGDVKTALVGSLATLLGAIGVRQAVLKPQVEQAALVHRDINLSLGYAQGQADAGPAPAVAPEAAPPAAAP